MRYVCRHRSYSRFTAWVKSETELTLNASERTHENQFLLWFCCVFSMFSMLSLKYRWIQCWFRIEIHFNFYCDSYIYCILSPLIVISRTLCTNCQYFLQLSSTWKVYVIHSQLDYCSNRMFVKCKYQLRHLRIPSINLELFLIQQNNCRDVKWVDLKESIRAEMSWQTVMTSDCHLDRFPWLMESRVE